MRTLMVISGVVAWSIIGTACVMVALGMVDYHGTITWDWR